MTGFLIPDHYKNEEPKSTEMNVASIIWGATLSIAVTCAVKAGRQSYDAHKRGKLVNAYIVMVWLEWIGSTIMSFIVYAWLKGFAEPSFWVFFFILVCWCLQIMMLLQIIINRVGLLIPDKKKVFRLKLGVGLVIATINVMAFFIWLPARLQISPTYEHINIIWDRAEKGVFLVLDLGLNIYFIYLVRSRLIANGLVKYYRLFHFNIGTAVISVSLDVLLMGATFLPSPVVYVHFHPFVYLLKLYIEMNLATLIAKVVRASTNSSNHKWPSIRNRPTHDHPSKVGMSTTITGGHERHGCIDNEAEFTLENIPWGRIQKTIQTDIVHRTIDEENIGEPSSVAAP